MSTEFKWDENKVAEFIQTKLHIKDSVAFDLIEQYMKESKQPKPEWEVLTYRFKPLLPQNVLVHKGQPKFGIASEGCLNYEVFSVKRLSDGLIVKIGDLIGHRLGDAYLTIDRFEINTHGICAIDKEDDIKQFNCKNWKKIKEILFTSEDGVPIYDDQTIYYVGKNSFQQGISRAAFIQKGHHDSYLYFSSQEKAHAHVLMNKPLFSINEIFDIGDVQNKFFQNRFIEKAKEKLNTK